MSNEEKILEMLTEMKAVQDEMKAAQDEMKAAQDEMKAVQTKQGQQIARMEERLDELDTRSLRSAILLETEVAKKIQLVYEGQALLKEKMEELAPKERVEALEDRVIALETVSKSMLKRLSVLEKAQ